MFMCFFFYSPENAAIFQNAEALQFQSCASTLRFSLILFRGSTEGGGQFYFIFAVLRTLFSCIKMSVSTLKLAPPWRDPPKVPLDLSANFCKRCASGFENAATFLRFALFFFWGMLSFFCLSPWRSPPCANLAVLCHCIIWALCSVLAFVFTGGSSGDAASRAPPAVPLREPLLGGGPVWWAYRGHHKSRGAGSEKAKRGGGAFLFGGSFLLTFGAFFCLQVSFFACSPLSPY